MSWVERDGKLTRSFELESFPAAIEFVTKVADIAEAEDHHPDIDVRWRTVTLAVNTHDQGGAITAKDHALAAAVDALLGPPLPLKTSWMMKGGGAGSTRSLSAAA